MAYKKILVSLFAALTIHSVTADEVTLQNGLNGYTGCDDASIATNNWGSIVGFFPNQNYGNSTELKVSRESCCSYPTARTVIKFDLSSIPQNATIQKATLSVYVFDKSMQLGTGGTPNNAAKSICMITEPWQENTINWINQPAFDSTATAQNTNTNVGVWEDYDITSAITNIIKNSGNNYGFMIKFPSETGYKGAMIHSSECSTAAYRPKLTITYTAEPDARASQVNAISTHEGKIIKTDASAVKK